MKLNSYNKAQINKYQKSVDIINSMENIMKEKPDDYFPKRTNELKNQIESGEKLEQYLEEAFALVREAAVRTVGMRHFDVQLMGGMALHFGNICEMKTGEGKTLVATLAAYLNALTGKGVHIITVNDYLAKRDATEMSPIYNFLGLTCSYIISGSSNVVKRDAYLSDITYITNSELGFDYLKNNMVTRAEEKFQRPLNYCIVDEVDSILIDEARVPLIISGPTKNNKNLYVKTQKFVDTLTAGDYEIDYKTTSCDLTDSGVEKVEKYFNLKNYSDFENEEIRHAVHKSLLANFLYLRDDKYVVVNKKVHIVDDSTGRISIGRRWTNGLHQAIEAKEKVPIEPENITVATITYQNFFRMYNKVSGMTGTAQTEAEEFREIYNLPVIVIPTNKPMIREDLPDRIYKTSQERDKDVIKYISSIHKTGQPILVGTNSVEKSEALSRALNKLKIKHEVLNAKYFEKEAEIIAKAGQKNAITISTNMAGRGTDIKLGEGVVELGGLYILGSERHENRRIDNQLRGRAGRQGDPGMSQFFVSLDDEIVKRASLDTGKILLDGIKSVQVTEDGTPDTAIQNKTLSNMIERAQLMLECSSFDARKNTLRADSLLTKQREMIYKDRDIILYETDMNSQIKKFIKFIFTELYDSMVLSHSKKDYGQYFNEYIDFINEKYNAKLDVRKYDGLKYSRKTVQSNLQDVLDDINYALDKRTQNIHPSVINACQIDFSIKTVDRLWQKHLDNMDDAKTRSMFAHLSGTNMYIMFNEEGHRLYNDLIYNIRSEIIKIALNLTIKMDKHKPSRKIR